MEATMRDSQRSRVYKWESKLFESYGLSKSIKNFDDCMSLKECNKFASKIWNTYKNKFYRNFNERRTRVASVKCSNTNGGRKGIAFGGFYYVKGNRYVKDGRKNCYKKMQLPRWARSKQVIIHEVAHFLCPNDIWHHKEYVGVYMFLLNKYLGFTFRAMQDLAYEMNVDWSMSDSKYLQKAFRKACKPEIDAYVSELKGGK